MKHMQILHVVMGHCADLDLDKSFKSVMVVEVHASSYMLVVSRSVVDSFVILSR